MVFFVDDVAEHSLPDHPVQNLIDLNELHCLTVYRLFLLFPGLAVTVVRVHCYFVPVMLVDATA